MLWSYNCQSPTHTTVWVHSNWWSKANYHSALHWCREKLPIKACYTVKSHLTRPQTLTAVKVSKQQPPQPCAFDTPLRARTVPGLFGKAGLDGKPPPFWEATMACTRATPVLKRKLQQLPFSEFAQISRAKRLKFSQNSADDTLFTQPGSQNAILERNAQIIINF